MPAAFRQTLGALAHARRRRRRLLVGLGVAGVLGGVWLLWFTLAQVSLYAVAERARVTASAEVHPVDVSLAGRVIEVALQPGAEVATCVLRSTKWDQKPRIVISNRRSISHSAPSVARMAEPNGKSTRR